MLQRNHLGFETIKSVPLRKAKFGVFTPEGHLLGAWDTPEQADQFRHPGTGRYVAEVTEVIELVLH